jgi:hypothetical protein
LLRQGGVLWASPDLRLVGKETPALRWAGHLAGVYNLTLEENKQVLVETGASNNLESETPFDPQTGRSFTTSDIMKSRGKKDGHLDQLTCWVVFAKYYVLASSVARKLAQKVAN